MRTVTVTTTWRSTDRVEVEDEDFERVYQEAAGGNYVPELLDDADAHTAELVDWEYQL